MQEQYPAVDPEIKAPLCLTPTFIKVHFQRFLPFLSSSKWKTGVGESAISITNSQTWKSCLSQSSPAV